MSNALQLVIRLRHLSSLIPTLQLPNTADDVRMIAEHVEGQSYERSPASCGAIVKFLGTVTGSNAISVGRPLITQLRHEADRCLNDIFTPNSILQVEFRANLNRVDLIAAAEVNDLVTARARSQALIDLHESRQGFPDFTETSDQYFLDLLNHGAILTQLGDDAAARDLWQHMIAAASDPPLRYWRKRGLERLVWHLVERSQASPRERALVATQWLEETRIALTSRDHDCLSLLEWLRAEQSAVSSLLADSRSNEAIRLLTDGQSEYARHTPCRMSTGAAGDAKFTTMTELSIRTAGADLQIALEVLQPQADGLPPKVDQQALFAHVGRIRAALGSGRLTILPLVDSLEDYVRRRSETPAPERPSSATQ